jgi:hypothetical protein
MASSQTALADEMPLPGQSEHLFWPGLALSKASLLCPGAASCFSSTSCARRPAPGEPRYRDQVMASIGKAWVDCSFKILRQFLECAMIK